jgi:hypothetical protein
LISVAGRSPVAESNGLTHCSIADALTAEGVPTRLARRWHTTLLPLPEARQHTPSTATRAAAEGEADLQHESQMPDKPHGLVGPSPPKQVYDQSVLSRMPDAQLSVAALLYRLTRYTRQTKWQQS